MIKKKGNIKAADMPASYPVFRSGLVLASNITLTEDQARTGVSYMEARRNAFMSHFTKTLEALGAVAIEILPARPTSHEDGPDTEGRNLKFMDIAFSFGRYRLESRIAVTICENDRQSKIAVRILCLELNKAPAESLTPVDVAAFFAEATNVTAALTDAAESVYGSVLDDYLKETPGVGDDVEALELTRRYAFTTRAYDSHDESAFDFIEDLNEGDHLSDLLKNENYRRVFEELWNVAYAGGEAADVDVNAAVAELRNDRDSRMALLNGRRDLNGCGAVEQRGLVLSKITEPADGLPRIDFTGVMCEPSPIEAALLAADVAHKSPAFRLSLNLFAKYAQRF